VLFLKFNGQKPRQAPSSLTSREGHLTKMSDNRTESKQDQLDASDSDLFNQLYLNMFRASLRPSSGE
jgi:hypothetical protein